MIIFFSTYSYAQSDTTENLLDTSLTLEAEDIMNEDAAEKIDSLEEFMVTKELEGKIKTVGADFIVVMIEEAKELQLIVDAETLIYINDEKSELEKIQSNDEIFAYYIEEHGILKCDWVEISR